MPTPTPPVIPDSKDAEAAFNRVQSLIEAVPETNLDPLNVDLDKVGKAAYALAQRCVSPDVWPRLALLPAELYDASNRITELVDLSLAASWVATRGLMVRAAQSEAQLPQSLVQEATAVKARMQATAEYCLDGTDATRELASIRSGTGYDDLKHDLRRLAVLYRDYKSELSGKRYDPNDEAKALALADDINLRQRGPTTADHSKLERRIWKLLRASGERAYAAAHFVTDTTPLVQKSIPSIHAWRDIGRKAEPTAPTPSGPTEPAQPSS
ncbi:MAG TPA: hypothetical protein PK095_10345 [Myxococcota bacterium]|nr:hypothetical protein [Myxococcota bacterium]